MLMVWKAACEVLALILVPCASDRRISLHGRQGIQPHIINVWPAPPDLCTKGVTSWAILTNASFATTGLDRQFTAEEMFRYIFAILRGGTRPFRAHWGISIYGQSDPALNPLAVTLAYDMGARHIWYWTSDHGHHLPWSEQLALSRLVREHAKNHPRPSVYETQIERDKLITIPYGYIPVLETADRKNCWDLWWVREMDAGKQNDASIRYQLLMRRLFEEVIRSLDAGEDFDIGIDSGDPVSGYKQIVHITAE